MLLFYTSSAHPSCTHVPSHALLDRPIILYPLFQSLSPIRTPRPLSLVSPHLSIIYPTYHRVYNFLLSIPGQLVHYNSDRCLNNNSLVCCHVPPPHYYGIQLPPTIEYDPNVGSNDYELVASTLVALLCNLTS